MMTLQKLIEAKRPFRKGMALIITLFTVVLLTLLVMVFFSKAMINRQISFSSANLAKTEMLAQAALETVIGELRQEIVENSVAVDNISTASPVYQPSTPAKAFPSKLGTVTPDTMGKETLVKVSAKEIGIHAKSTVVASPIPLDTESLNGRAVSSKRWFGSKGPQLGSQSTLPTWLYMTRSNGVKNPPIADAKQSTGKDYVIGRFGYSIYDVSGRFDVNVAGYPTSATNVIGAKSSQAYADLSVLRTVNSSIDEKAVDDFITWRNGTTDTATGTNYQAHVSEYSSKYGFLQVKDSHNVLLSRGEMLRAMKEKLVPNTPEYFTHFSREVNAPSWRPNTNSTFMTNYVGGAGTTPVNYLSDANKDESANRFATGVRHTTATTVTHYNDDGTSDSYRVKPGDPVMQHRFSLAKLAWLEHAGAKSGISAAAIRACFGLEWKSPTVNQPYYYWEYVEVTASPKSIKTLAQVATEGREPNFFELLNAGILSGSLAKSPGAIQNPLPQPNVSVVGPGGQYFEDYGAEPSLHVMQIGANIIDQSDVDSYPTAIYFPAFATGAQKYEFYNTAFGIENLPFLHRIYLIAFEDTNAPPETAWGTATNWKFYMQPEIWNPHQSLPTTATGAKPTHLRLRAYGGVQGDFNNAQLTSKGCVGSVIDYDSNPSYRDLYFSDANAGLSTSNFYSKPTLLLATMADASVATTDPVNLCTAALLGVAFGGSTSVPAPYDHLNFAAIYAGSSSWPKNLAQTPWSNALPSMNPQLSPNFRLTLALEYWDGNRWTPYTFMSRIGILLRNNSTCPQVDMALQNGTLQTAGWTWNHASDPRTDRLSISVTRTNGGNIGSNFLYPEQSVDSDFNAAKGFSKQVAMEDYYPRTTDGFYYQTTPASTSSMSGKMGMPMWMMNLITNPDAANNAGSTYNSYYMDPDGVVRPGDGVRRKASTGEGCYLYHSTSQPTTTDQRRPVILNRSFRSVGELGYAFRDLPGKNLDLWSTSSADAALLDFFSVNDGPNVVAGKINPNSSNSLILQSLLSSATKTEYPATTTISTTEANTIATQIMNGLADKSLLPIASRTDLVLSLSDRINAAFTQDSDKKNKALAEAPTRALSENLNTGTWNLLIDLVAQTGRFPESASGLHQFLVEGEKRYWLHLAIDRQTAKVVSQQLEPVYE